MTSQIFWFSLMPGHVICSSQSFLVSVVTVELGKSLVEIPVIMQLMFHLFFSHATKEPGTAEPFIAMPIDLRTITSGFLVLMSDGLYEAYEAYTKRPSFVNQDLGYLIAQEMRRSADITSIAQNVVESVKQLYRSTCKRSGSKGRLDDITLIIRNLNFFTGLHHTVSYPGGMSSLGYIPQNTAPVLPNPQQNQFFPGYPTMTPGGFRPSPQGYTPPDRYRAHTDMHRVASDSRLPSDSRIPPGGLWHGVAPMQPLQSQPPWNQQTVSVAASTGAPLYSPPRGQPPLIVASADGTTVPVIGNSYSQAPPPVTTPNQQTVRSRTDTHGYVNVSPATAATATNSNAAYNVNGDPTSPGHNTSLDVPRKKDSGYVNVTPTTTAMGHKRYSDSQLDQLNIDDVIPDRRNARTPPPTTDHDPSVHSVTNSATKSPIPTPRKIFNPPQSTPKRPSSFKQHSDERRGSDEFDLYGWKPDDDATPVSSQPLSITKESENGPSTGGTLTGADLPSSNQIHAEPVDDVEDTEDDDGNGMGILTLDADTFNSDFSEASDFEEEEELDGMIKSHVRFDTLKFNVNLSWDDL